jgi:hypothetical protein
VETILVSSNIIIFLRACDQQKARRVGQDAVQFSFHSVPKVLIKVQLS